MKVSLKFGSNTSMQIKNGLNQYLKTYLFLQITKNKIKRIFRLNTLYVEQLNMQEPNAI